MSVKTFRQLFVDGHGVVIPMLQRDYAQGRNDGRSRAVSSAFMDSLHVSLADLETRPLDLDFVYGRWDEDARALEPLDGQQRLTTLLLLHWYLAQRDHMQADLRGWMQQSGKSRFSYRTRPSAEEFVDQLVGQDVDIAALSPAEDALSSWIEDRPWFLRVWKRDPTVSGCLTMLNAIHKRFHDLSGGYEILIKHDEPRVLLHELRLRDFGLSDDLYVKMNARGKPLTTFEVFKAELEQFIEEKFREEPCPHDREKTWKEYVSDRLDRGWADFLWNHRDQRNTIDSQFLQLVRLAALIHCAMRATPEDETFAAHIQLLLLESEPSIRFFREQVNCLDRAFVQRLVVLIDALAASPTAQKLGVLERTDYFNEDAALAALLAPGKGQFGLATPDWAKLAAYGIFLMARAGDLRSEASGAACHEWMRVVCNLVNNTDIDRFERLAGALQSIAAVREVCAGPDFLEHVAEGNVLGQVFNREQREEERIKARLIRRASSWRNILERGETHFYLRGNLRFPLRASRVLEAYSVKAPCDWSDPDHERLQQSLQHWYERVCAVFPADRSGLVELDGTEAPEYLWERALLCHGDYLLPSYRNKCLVNDGDRNPSWKRLLQDDGKSEIVERLLQQIDPNDLAASLREIIASGTLDDTPLWRRLLVRGHRSIAACSKRMLRFEDETVYLLRTTQRNGYHVDLYVFTLYLVVKDRAPAGFDPPNKPEVRGGGGPSMLILNRTDATATLKVTTESGWQVFRLAVAERWVDAVAQLGWPQEADEWVRRMPLERGEEELLALLGLFSGQSGQH
jgi:hypothetical protein